MRPWRPFIQSVFSLHSSGVPANKTLKLTAARRSLASARVPCLRSCLGVQVSCPGVRGAEGQGKRQGVTVRWGLQDAWNERAGRGTRTGEEVWDSRGKRARHRKALHPQLGCA
jgi:hypothetical protein